MYSLFGVTCSFLFVLLLRSVVGDMYGRRPAAHRAAEPDRACLEDIERLYAQISARAVQPAPGGLEGGALAREWDEWTRRWEDEVDRVSHRCALGPGNDRGVARSLAEALDGVEELRRRLSRSGAEAAEEARRVKEALTGPAAS